MASPSPRDQAVLDELKETRAIAQGAVTDSLSTRAVMLRMEIVNRDADLARANAEIAALREELTTARKRISDLENPDTPAL